MEPTSRRPEGGNGALPRGARGTMNPPRTVLCERAKRERQRRVRARMSPSRHCRGDLPRGLLTSHGQLLAVTWPVVPRSSDTSNERTEKKNADFFKFFLLDCRAFRTSKTRSIRLIYWRVSFSLLSDLIDQIFFFLRKDKRG